MKKSGKNIEKARKGVEARPYTLQEAVPLLQKVKYAKFDETVEVTLRLGVDPKHADQMVRGTVVLPHGLGKNKKVLVIATGEKVREAEAAGAKTVCTACPFCYTMISDGIKELELSEKLQAIDIARLVVKAAGLDG